MRTYIDLVSVSVYLFLHLVIHATLDTPITIYSLYAYVRTYIHIYSQKYLHTYVPTYIYAHYVSLLINPLTSELHPICHLLALFMLHKFWHVCILWDMASRSWIEWTKYDGNILGARHIFHANGLRVNTEASNVVWVALLHVSGVCIPCSSNRTLVTSRFSPIASKSTCHRF
jgi:hypothetical protein